jgi:hypothetical protein
MPCGGITMQRAVVLARGEGGGRGSDRLRVLVDELFGRVLESTGRHLVVVGSQSVSSLASQARVAVISLSISRALASVSSSRSSPPVRYPFARAEKAGRRTAAGTRTRRLMAARLVSAPTRSRMCTWATHQPWATSSSVPLRQPVRRFIRLGLCRVRSFRRVRSRVRVQVGW